MPLFALVLHQRWDQQIYIRWRLAFVIVFFVTLHLHCCDNGVWAVVLSQPAAFFSNPRTQIILLFDVFSKKIKKSPKIWRLWADFFVTSFASHVSAFRRGEDSRGGGELLSHMYLDFFDSCRVAGLPVQPGSQLDRMQLSSQHLFSSSWTSEFFIIRKGLPNQK